MKRFALVLLVAAMAGCGSTEPTIDPATASVVGTYSLTSQTPVNPAGVFIPDTQTWIQYTSDVYTLTDAGTWTRSYAGTTRVGSRSTPTSGSNGGTYARVGRTITFQSGGQFFATASFTGSGMTLTDQYFLYAFSRP
jgi:hypothetical protein